jgi:hypothetical protein
MLDSQYRVPLHESAHSLVDLIFTGSCGRITLDGKGGGTCQAGYADDEMGILQAQGQAYSIYRGTRAIAGERAEWLIFGDPGRGSVEDRAVQQAAQEYLQEKGLYVPRDTFATVADYLLRCHRKGLMAMAQLCYDQWRGSVSGKALTDVAIARDPSLMTYDNTPLLASTGVDTWRVKWFALCEQASVPRPAQGRSVEATAD